MFLNYISNHYTKAHLVTLNIFFNHKNKKQRHFAFINSLLLFLSFVFISFVVFGHGMGMKIASLSRKSFYEDNTIENTLEVVNSIKYP